MYKRTGFDAVAIDMTDPNGAAMVVTYAFKVYRKDFGKVEGREGGLVYREDIKIPVGPKDYEASLEIPAAYVDGSKLGAAIVRANELNAGIEALCQQIKKDSERPSNG